MGFVSGIECIMDIDNLSKNVVLKDIWGLKEIPHSSRIGDWLYRNSKRTARPTNITSSQCFTLWVNIAVLAYNRLTGINREAKGLRFKVFSVVGRFIKYAGTKFLKLYCDKREFKDYLMWREICLNL